MKLQKYRAIQLHMMLVMTSWMPNLALSQPMRAPISAPPAVPAISTTGIWIGMGRSTCDPTMTASTVPRMYWPSAPMLNRPAL